MDIITYYNRACRELGQGCGRKDFEEMSTSDSSPGLQAGPAWFCTGVGALTGRGKLVANCPSGTSYWW